MDSRTGEIMEEQALRRKLGDADFDRFAKSIPDDDGRPTALSPRHQRILHERGSVKIGRNDPCACGSGKKFKKCCYAK